MPILNIAGYKFTALTQLEHLRETLLQSLSTLNLKGTVLLSCEGINLSLAGPDQAIRRFQTQLLAQDDFADMRFHETYSETLPFKKLKVKIKTEIITLRQPDLDPLATRAPAISPAELKNWLDEKRDFTLLDTRNEYETKFGTFKEAQHLGLKDFGELPKKVANLQKKKPIVMFCTGGIRCEKAALNMLHQGFEQVYQLDGGILGYFAQVGHDHYEGECFVFDERIALDPALRQKGTTQCVHCQGPVGHDENCGMCSNS